MFARLAATRRELRPSPNRCFGSVGSIGESDGSSESPQTGPGSPIGGFGPMRPANAPFELRSLRASATFVPLDPTQIRAPALQDMSLELG